MTHVKYPYVWWSQLENGRIKFRQREVPMQSQTEWRQSRHLEAQLLQLGATPEQVQTFKESCIKQVFRINCGLKFEFCLVKTFWDPNKANKDNKPRPSVRPRPSSSK